MRCEDRAHRAGCITPHEERDGALRCSGERVVSVSSRRVQGLARIGDGAGKRVGKEKGHVAAT